jgi:ATP-dependent DNA ligase
VPYWWDKTHSSLAATIYNQRPDLFTEQPKGVPIPSNPQEKSNAKIISTTRLMTATLWDNSTMDPTGWYLTEKFDGMRLYWDGKEFFTRQGKKVKAPLSFTSKMPSVSLDGELW